MSSRVLITGAGGFIGSHLAEAVVRSGARVRAMVHYNGRGGWSWLEDLPPDILDRVEIVAADITDPFLVHHAVEGCERVYHLAAQIAIPYSYIAPASFVATNIVGTLNVLEACRSVGVARLVHTSTSETYGTAQYVPIDEKHPLVGQSPYSASKIGADALVESYHRSFGLPVSTVRPFNTFGPRQSARAVIPTVITQALSGAKAIRIGATAPVRDFTFVTDTVAGFMAVMESDAAVGRVSNIGSGKGVSIGELAQDILAACGSDATIVVDEDRFRPEASEVQRLVCDSSWAREHIGWTPRATLKDGLAQTVAWFRSHLGSYKPGRYNV